MEHINWAELKKLRQVFLSEVLDDRLDDYWSSWRLLRDYDQTFAQRIAWKWQAVLKRIDLSGWRPDKKICVLDWGCGTAQASRNFFKHHVDCGGVLFLFDRSAKAMAYAKEKIDEEFSQRQLSVHVGLPSSSQTIDVLLLSHVSNELDERAWQELDRLVFRSKNIIWVEAGTLSISQLMSQKRDVWLHEGWYAWAPCTHLKKCPINSDQNSKDWCHHFTPPPGYVHQSAQWRHFADYFGIDLRRIPYQFICLSRQVPPAFNPAFAQLVGDVRRYKAFHRLQLCINGELKSVQCDKRTQKKLWKVLKNQGRPQLWQYDSLNQTYEPVVSSDVSIG